MSSDWQLRLWLAKRRWSRFYDSIWFLPMLLTIGGVGLFVLTSWLDRSGWIHPQAEQLPIWADMMLFGGSAASAQTLLATVAGMWATVIGISFSTMLLTTQLTATKYVAQVLPLFERDRLNQTVLGTFLATVVYALLVLRTVRVDEPEFVPHLGVSVALVLAVAALFLLIAFISNNINLVRPQFFMEHTVRATKRALRTYYPPERLDYLSPIAPDGLPLQPPAGCVPICSRRRGTLTGIAWRELYLGARRYLQATPAGGGRCVLYLHKRVGDMVDVGEVLAHLSQPDCAPDARRFMALVRDAHEVQPTRRHEDDPDFGLESLSGLTIKGLTQGDLDVAFEGVDYHLVLLGTLAKQPKASSTLRLHADEGELIIVRPVIDLLGKLIREMTLISEVALAPSLPFRPVTEGISSRFTESLLAMAEAGEWEAFDAVLAHLQAWYESAFFHMDWLNGMRHLATDLVGLALAVKGLDHPGAFEAVFSLMLAVRDRLAPDAQARQAFHEAFAHLAREVDLPLDPLRLMPEIGSAAPDDGRGG